VGTLAALDPLGLETCSPGSEGVRGAEGYERLLVRLLGVASVATMAVCLDCPLLGAWSMVIWYMAKNIRASVIRDQ
jgi:hypothetical protein